MSLHSQSNWHSHNQPPSLIPNIRKIFTLNSEQLLIILDADDDGILRPLWKYTIKTDTWTMLCNMPNGIVTRFHTSALSTNKQTLYIFGESGHIAEFNLSTQKYLISPQKYHDGSHCRSLFINNKFHIFGGWFGDDKSHFIWDSNRKCLNTIHKFDEIIDIAVLNCHEVVYINSKQSVLIFPYRSYHIYLYSLITKKCKVLPFTMNDYIVYPAAVVTYDNRFVIQFSTGTPRDIFVIDLETLSYRKSKIQSPVAGAVVIRNDNERKAVLTFGYLHACWKVVGFECVRFPTYHLVKLIESFYSVELIHLISCNAHYSIEVNDILDET